MRREANMTSRFISGTAPSPKKMKYRPILTRSIVTLIAAAAFDSAGQAQTNGTWNTDANGNWSATGSWLNGAIANGADGTAKFSFNITANRTVTLDTAARTIGNLVFEDATTASSDWILSSSNATNVLTLDVSSGQANISVLNRTATINTVLAGTDGINVTGNTSGTSGTLILNAANTFTGGVTVSGAVLQLNNASAAGSNTITIASSTNTASANRLQINGGLTIGNNIIIEGGVSPLAGFGAIQQTGTGRATVNGTVTINGNTANGGHLVGGTAVGNELVINGVITSSNQVVQRAGRVIYAGGGTGYSDLAVTGTALVGATDGISTNATASLGISGNATLDLNGFDQTLAGVVLGVNGANAASIGSVAIGNRTLTLTGILSTQGNAAHTITGTGTLALGNNNAIFLVNDGTVPNDLTINSGISGAAGFNKQGFGTLVLNGSVTNTGPVVVDGGTLSGSGSLAGDLIVNSGSTLSGGLSVGGKVTLLDFTTLSPGTGSAAGTLTASKLTFDSGTTTLNLKVGSANDQIKVTGANGLTTTGDVAVQIQAVGGPLPVGTTDLITHSGTIQGKGLSGFKLSGVGHATASLEDTGTALRLNVTKATDTVIWTGSTNTVWDTSIENKNWKFKTGGAATGYLDGDDVRFEDLATPAPTSVDISFPITPSRVVVDNTAANPFTFNGFGITGPTGLTKNGTGTLVLANSNTYTGATTVNGGTLELDLDSGSLFNAPTNLGTSGVVLANGTTFKLTRDDADFTFERSISGTGTIVIDPHTGGAGASRSLTISGTNTGFTGLWKLSPSTGAGTAGGSFRLNAITQANLGSGTIDVDSGAQLLVSGTLNNNITITGAGYGETAGGTPAAGTGLAYGGIGALRIDGATLSGNITLDGNSKIGAHNSTGTISGVISSTNATDMLILGGGTANHTLVLSGNNTYSGPTWVNSGGTTGTTLVQIGNNGTTGSLGGGNVTLYQDAMGAQIRFSRADGYTLAPTQSIVAVDNGTASNLTKAAVFVNTTGTGLTLNNNTIDLSNGTTGGNIHVAGNSGANGVNGAILNINGADTLVDVANFYVGDQANFSGTVNQSNGTVNVINQIRIGHFSTETSSYNISGGTFKITGPAPATFPFATTGTTEQNGGIYVGVDGTGNLTQSGGTVSTNFLVLDNRGDTGAGANMPTGVDTYTLSGGTLVLNHAFGIISRNASAAVNLNGGTIQAATGISPNLDTNKITVGGPVTLDTNGSNTFTLYGSLAGNGTISLTGGGTFRTQDGTGTTSTQIGGTMPGGSLGTASLDVGATSTLQANRTGTNIWSGALSGPGAFVKQNSGVLFLTGNGSGFTGSTTVSAGRLVLPNVFGSAAISVADGAAIGGEPAVTNLTLGSTTGSTVFFNPATAGALTAANLTANGVTSLDFAAVPTAPGPFTALKYTTKSGTGTFALANAANYRSANVSDSGGTVTVDVTTKNLTWTGSAGGTWDTNATANWNDGTASDKFFAGDKVTFGDGPTATAVTVTSGVSPWKTTVNSNTANYTLTSTGNGISGPGSLEKSGTSTLTLSGPNTYSGQTLINGGSINISSATSLGNGAPTNTIAFDGGKLTSSASIDLGTARAVSVGAGGGTISTAGTAALTVTIPGALSGSGTLNLTNGATAAPTYILSGNSSGYTGTINVDSVGATTGATTLRLSNALTPASGTINLAAGVVNAAATGLDLQNVSVGNGVALVMNTATSGTNSFRSQLTGSGTWNGPIALNGNNIAQVTSNGVITLNGNVSDGTNGFTGTFFLRGAGQGVVNGTINIPTGTVSKTDASAWTINSTGNNWASSIVAVGTLKMGATNVLPTAVNVTLGQNDANAAALDLNGFNQTIGSLASNPTSGTNANSKSITSATPATLTINQASNTTYGSLITGGLSLVKDGLGTLTLGGASTFTGNVTVNGGTLVAGGSTVTSLGSATTAGRTVAVNNGSTLSFTTNNVFGSGVGNNNLPAFTLNASTLTSTRYNVLGDVTLNGANLTQATTDSGNFEGYQFRGSVTVNGTAPSLIESTNGKADHLGGNTFFDVADVTGSSAADLLVTAPLRDQSGDFASATGGLTKTGAGTMELSAANSYTGPTAINAGTLLVTGSITGAVTVNTGGTLAGSGTTGPVNVLGGTVAPGNGPGTLTTGSFSLDSTSVLKLELAQAGTSGSGINDLLAIIGDLTLDGNLQLTELPGFANGTYRLFTYTGALTNSGLNIDPAFLIAHPGSQIDTATIGQVNLVVVPEPGAVISLLGGTGLLLGFQRARRRRF